MAKRKRLENLSVQFAKAKDQKTLLRVQKVLDEYEGWNIKGFLFGFKENGDYSGYARCEVKIHITRNHELVFSDPFTAAKTKKNTKQIPEAAVTRIKKYNSYLVSAKNLSQSYFDCDIVSKRDEILLESLGFDPQEAIKLKSSRYFIAKEANIAAEEMVVYISENVPFFIEKGHCGLQVDHKAMINKTSDFQDQAYCIALTLTLGSVTVVYPLIFEAVDSTSSEESIPIFEQTLEITENLPTFEQVGIELEKLAVPKKNEDGEFEEDFEIREYKEIFARSCFIKLMFFMAGKAYVSESIGEVEGKESSRVLGATKAAVFVYWPTHKCNLYKLIGHMEKSSDYFFGKIPKF
ncbi:Oidioi.mRNA.OKI2018_I69.chr1.g36.t1.cds [Oikopleura dioica]|uniref:Oidioi.mRNA.OKI2018_I69.chr1.g36.t1.cds n=1 Tax=Oikopleura dioica TaxID=34765 RepID=A0ABN7SIK5_OIKDI|nr:Oidioi.mRNA.OKI2018_I69.chr1.g36.t1.cds [Oikopleura dioica]